MFFAQTLQLLSAVQEYVVLCVCVFVLLLGFIFSFALFIPNLECFKLVLLCALYCTATGFATFLPHFLRSVGFVFSSPVFMFVFYACWLMCLLLFFFFFFFASLLFNHFLLLILLFSHLYWSVFIDALSPRGCFLLVRALARVLRYSANI